MSSIGYHASHEQYPPDALLRHVKAAERAGFSSAMCSDHFAPWSTRQGESGFAWSWLGAALEATSLSFGTVTAPGYRYNPVIIAQAAATLARMYPGRFWLALGTGQALNEHITGGRWPEKPERNERLGECVDIMRALWEGATVTSEGLIRIDEATLHTLPEEPPMLLGAALSPETAEWVASWADGLITVGKPIEELEEIVDAFRSGGGEGKPMVLQQQVSWAETHEKATEMALEQWRYNIFEPPLLERLAFPEEFEGAAEYIRREDLGSTIKISADLEEHVEWLKRDVDLGFDRVLVHHVGRENQSVFIDAYGEHVLPKLRQYAGAENKGATGHSRTELTSAVSEGADRVADCPDGRVPPADYKPLDEYGAIGNCRTVAMVGSDGSIDWCPLPQLSDSSVFSAILDRSIGGRFRVGPATPVAGRQEYLGPTNVLKTSFVTEGGELSIVDFMPIAGSIEGRGGSSAPPQIHRVVRADEGSVEVEVEWSPRFDFARGKTSMTLTKDGAVASAGSERLTLSGLPLDAEVELKPGPTLRARFVASGGHGVALVCAWGDEEPVPTLAALFQTAEVWRSWVEKPEATGDRAWAGEWADRVVRSELTLKLLTHAETGAVAAAATTSLPEWIGGQRNWDYRYAWIRDAGETIRAFIAMGHVKEAREFLEWIQGVTRDRSDLDRPHIMYGLHGEPVESEEVLGHFEGYRGSQPVNIGNDAYDQLQLDAFGQLIVSVHEMLECRLEVGPDLLAFVSQLADHACKMWREPDHGIWEMSETHHFVHSKVMTWVALDRAIHMAEAGHISGNVKEWRKQRDAIHAEVIRRGFDKKTGAFTQHYDTDALDAANLQIGLQEFLPYDDARLRETIDATLERLTSKEGLLYRYRTDDGIPNDEGVFVLPTFWMVNTLVLTGRLEEAHDLFDKIWSKANHLGLYAEQVDPVSGALLGNFPQAFSHIGLINSALYLSKAAGRKIPVVSLSGEIEHRKVLGHV